MMSETLVTPAAPRPVKEEDLSDQIARSVAREPREQVTCRRVAPNHYRCNWWAAQNTSNFDNPAMSGMLVTTSRISRSRFLRVVKEEGRLQMMIITPGGSREQETKA
jgi:hypothetical protein